MLLIKLNEGTAARRRVPVALVDDTDGKTAETGVTISAGDMKVSKNGAAEGNHGGTLTELAGGDYYYEFSSGEVDTVGYITGRIVKSGVRTFRIAAQVVAFDPYDATRLGLTALPNAAAEAAGGLLTRGTGTGQLEVSSGKASAQVKGMDADTVTASAVATGAIDADAIAADAITAAKIAADAIGASELAASAANEIRDAILSDSTPFPGASVTEVRLARLDAAVTSRAVAGDAMALTTAERSAVQAELEEDGASLLDTLRDRLTAARAGYLDNLNVGGNVASSAEATAIQNNTRIVRVVPEVIERPDSGTTTYRIELFLYDETGNMEAPDSAPTIALVNQAGTDRTSRLDSTTMALVETGRYRAIYTASAADALEQLVWTFSVVEGGATRKYGNGSIIVDTTAVDFTAGDRAKLDELHDNRLTSARATKLDQLDAAVSSRAAAADYTSGRAAKLDEITAGRMAELDAANMPADLDTLKTRIPGTVQPQTGDAYARLGAPAGASVSADVAAVKADTTSIVTSAASILARLGAFAGTGANTLKGWLKALVRKDAGVSGANLPSEINESTSGTAGAYDAATDSLEAIRDNSGGSSLTQQQVRDAMKLAPTAGAPAAGSVDTHLDDIQAKTDTIGGLSVTVVGPVATDGATLELVQGDDYLAADGRSLEWVNAAGTWPNLTSATVRLTVGGVTVTGSVVVPTGVNQKVRVELTSAQTATLSAAAGVGKATAYDVEVTLSNGHKVTLVLATAYVRSQVTA